MKTIIRFIGLSVGFTIMVSIGYDFTTWQYWAIGAVFLLLSVSHWFGESK